MRDAFARLREQRQLRILQNLTERNNGAVIAITMLYELRIGYLRVKVPDV